MCQPEGLDPELHRAMRAIAHAGAATGGYESERETLGCRCHLPRRPVEPPPPLPATVPWNSDYDPL
jgi:hypothetical protein